MSTKKCHVVINQNTKDIKKIFVWKWKDSFNKATTYIRNIQNFEWNELLYQITLLDINLDDIQDEELIIF